MSFQRPLAPLGVWYLDALPDRGRVSAVELYRSVPWVALDVETTNIDNGDPRTPENRIVLGCVQREGQAPVIALSESEVLRQLEGLAQEPVVLVAHNAKFELGWMLRYGIQLHNLLVWDTMVAEYVLAGNRRVPLDLGSVAARYGLPGKERVVDALMRGGVCPSEIPQRWLADRCRRDTETALHIAQQQLHDIDRLDLGEVLLTRCIVTPVLAAIEREGLSLDADRVRREYAAQIKRRSEAEAELTTMAEGRNLRSSRQLAEYLYERLGFEEPTDHRGRPVRTATGLPSTNAAVLAELKARTPEQKRFLKLRAQYADADARITKALAFFAEVVERHNARFCGSFNQTVTQTHRLSSSGRKIVCSDGRTRGVQLQNLPREYKALFCPRSADYLMVEADGAQLEFRVAAFLGQDEQARRDIESSHDVHRYTASILYRVPEAEVTKKQRTEAKRHTFKPLYGGSAGTPRQREYYAAFRARYAGVTATQERWLAEVLRTKRLRTPWGLIFYWPDAEMDETGYVKHTANVYNYPIQSFATADVIPVSLVHLFWALRRDGLRAIVVNTVHDSVVMEVHKEDIDRVRALLVECFLDRTYRYLRVVYGLEMTVPLGVGYTVGTHWGDGKEETVSRL